MIIHTKEGRTFHHCRNITSISHQFFNFFRAHFTHYLFQLQVNEFIENVNSSSVTANLDNAEAQLDALMQVLACADRIGWAALSRKIVILLSDGLMHTAGDGKLGERGFFKWLTDPQQWEMRKCLRKSRRISSKCCAFDISENCENPRSRIQL